jgi:hypothetical protein
MGEVSFEYFVLAETFKAEICQGFDYGGVQGAGGTRLPGSEGKPPHHQHGYRASARCVAIRYRPPSLRLNCDDTSRPPVIAWAVPSCQVARGAGRSYFALQ